MFKIKIFKSDQSGISHILVPFTVILVVAIGGTFLLVSSHANSNAGTARHKPHHYSPVEKARFALAAADYWSHPIAVDSPRNNKYAYDIREVSCKPGSVKIKYVNINRDNRIAFTSDYAALKLPASSKNARQFNSKAYCKITFNLAHQNEIPTAGLGCMVFIHEYGHMLGHEHNANVESPMYNGYDVGKGGSAESFRTNQLAVLQKTLCEPFMVGRFGNDK